jgi:dTDP-L-rhamnose 4-epimerase
MTERVLVTGGAGFIGAHAARELLDHGYEVRALDNLDPQVHETGGRPAYLPDGAELVDGDVRDRDAVSRALEGCDAVLHLAARVGVGQSMYEIAEYTDVNSRGTGVLLEALLDQPVSSLVVASSMSIYGEGRYEDSRGRGRIAVERTREQLERGDWEPVGSNGDPLTPLPTPESKPPSLSSIYALNKYDQERMCLMFGSAYQVRTTALRFFNVYGRHQALSNPYTGVLAIFGNRLLNGRPPLIFEDGLQRRDFVSVHDVARSCRLALERGGDLQATVNIGSGESVTIAEIAQRLARVMGREDVAAEVTGEYRVGDIRHCFADVSLAREVLGYEPGVALEDGMAELAQWLEGETSTDRVEEMKAQLAERGLTV